MLPGSRLKIGAAALGLATIIVGAALWGSLGNGRVTGSTSGDQLLHAGLSAQLAGRDAEASADYEKLLDLQPSNVYAYYNLGLIDQRAGHPDLAEGFYRRALSINADFVPALYNLAIIRTGPAPKEAEALYRHVISVQPNNAQARLNLGFLLIQEGKPVQGRAELDQAVKLDPSLKSRLPTGS